MIGRPSLLMLTAITAALSTVAHGVGVAMPSPPPVAPPPATRLGVAIQQDLTARDRAAASRNRALDMRERVARATEQRIKADLLTRQALPANTKTSSGGKPAAEVGDQYDDLARIYQAMKPASAALVFEQLDMDVQMAVAQRMRERSTAMILSTMTPRGAAELSMALARKDPGKPRIRT